MKASKRRALKAKGWKVGSTEDFLRLSKEEVAYIELKIALGECLKERRKKRKLTQVKLADKLHSSQSRIAKMEAGDPSVSLDLLVRSLLLLGAGKRDLAKMIASAQRRVA